MRKVLVLLILIFTIVEVHGIDIETGVKGGVTSFGPADYDFRRKLDTYGFFQASRPKWSNGYNSSLFLRLTSDNGKFSSFSQYTNGTGNFDYRKRDLIAYVVLGSIRSATFSAPFLAAADSKVKINMERKDFFTDGIFYFFPNRFGAGIGYRSITATSKSNHYSFFRDSYEVDNRTFQTSGLQASLYGNFPLDKSGKAVMSLRGSYFNLIGNFDQSYSSTGVFFPGYFTQVFVGSPIAKRKGYEIDMAINLFPFKKIKDMVSIFVGLTFQESKVSVEDYGYLGLANSGNTSSTLLNSYVFSQLIEAPIYASPAYDRLYTLYFGVSVKFGTKPRVVEEVAPQ